MHCRGFRNPVELNVSDNQTYSYPSFIDEYWDGSTDNITFSGYVARQILQGSTNDLDFDPDFQYISNIRIDDDGALVFDVASINHHGLSPVEVVLLVEGMFLDDPKTPHISNVRSCTEVFVNVSKS